MDGSSVLPESWSASLFPDLLPDDPASNLPDLEIWNSSLLFPVSDLCNNIKKISAPGEAGRKVFSCGKCGQRFQHLKSLKRHEASKTACSKKVTPTFWDSEQFCRTLTSNSEGVEVVKEDLNNGGDTCSVCRVPFSSSDKLSIHAEEHFSRFLQFLLDPDGDYYS